MCAPQQTFPGSKLRKRCTAMSPCCATATTPAKNENKEEHGSSKRKLT